MGGARWVQQSLLDANVSAPVRVYAVWFNMYPGDARSRWRGDLLTDPRALQFWDETRSVGRLYYETVPRLWAKRAAESKRPRGGVLWDTYLLYGPEARWGNEPPEVISWGYTILLTRHRLERDLRQALGLSH